MRPPDNQPDLAPPLQYSLEPVPPLRHLLLHALQWVSFSLGIVFVTTALVAPGIGLGPRETVAFGSRVLVVTGLATLLQGYFGHGYPVLEGPAVIYWAAYLFAAQQAGPGGLALSDLEGSMLAAGAVVMLFALSGLARDLSRLFTPVISGTTLILISLSFAAGSPARFGGVSAEHPGGDPAYLLTVVLVILAGAAISVFGRGIVRTLPVLITAASAYTVAALLGRVDFSILRVTPLVALPQPLAWGVPTIQPGLALTFAIVGLLATINTYAAVEAAAGLFGHRDDDLRRRQQGGLLFTGVAQMLAGVGAAAGTASLAASVAVLVLSRAGARATMALAAAMLIALGFLPIVSAVLATAPLPIVNGLFFLIASNLLSLGLEQFTRVRFDNRLRAVVGISILAGLAVSYAPPSLFAGLPLGGSLLASNPIIVGTGAAFLGEHVLFGAWARGLTSRS